MQDSIRIEIRDLKEQMSEISPKTDSYAKLSLRIKELESRLTSGSGAPLRKVGRSQEARFNRMVYRNR